MHLDIFDYHLPEELIAQEPCSRRDQSRLLVLRRHDGSLAHHQFADLPALLSPGDLLILNDTRVVHARLVGRRATTGGQWEGLYVRTIQDGTWELLVQARGKLQAGETLIAEGEGRELPLELVQRTPAGRWLVRPHEDAPAPHLLAAVGQVPIPPYIRKGRADHDDEQRYQTIFARRDGAVAAPTAGLHLTADVFAALETRGIDRAFVTLHVGPGTFQPVKVEDVRHHRTEPEWADLPEATARAIAACKARGGKVVAVGTTSTRVLEWSGGQAKEGLADLTICPPYSFAVVDALVTNFHLPRSSLLLLVAALAGLQPILDAYRVAVAERYRFYSYGDAMLIL